MTEREAIAYIEDQSWSSSRLGLERTRELLAGLGDPQRGLKFVHVAGSNGKGSVCAMLESVLRKAGYRTGLYTSPHLLDFCERMQVNGERISGSALARLTERVKAVADAMTDHPSQFELSTAIGLSWFAEENCDVVVLEVGMGGGLDSTNIIDFPEVAVITGICLEHTEYLGDTVEKIASAKAGIIKPGCACVLGSVPSEAETVIRAMCAEKGVTLTLSAPSLLEPLCHDLTGQSFRWRGTELLLPLLGEHQLYNAAVALETVETLRRRGWSIPDSSVAAGLRTVKWPARMEVLGWEPLFILDGGHNLQCVQALKRTLEDYLPGEKITFITGVLADKDWRAMLDAAVPYADRFICLAPDSPRALAGDELAAELESRGVPAAVYESVGDSVRAAIEYGGTVVAFGSLYLAGAVRSAFGPIYRKHLRRKKIKARNALSDEQRAVFSEQIAARLISTSEFRNAKTVLIYKATKGEVRLDFLEAAPEAGNKRLIYPLCVSDTEMIALLPHGEDAWTEGYRGIREPVPEKSDLIEPEEIDLVVCPCSSFDEDCGRMGMGAGFYDRYLNRCVNAKFISVAFECQKSIHIPLAPWDKPMEMTVTEERIIFRRGGSE